MHLGDPLFQTTYFAEICSRMLKSVQSFVHKMPQSDFADVDHDRLRWELAKQLEPKVPVLNREAIKVEYREIIFDTSSKAVPGPDDDITLSYGKARAAEYRFRIPYAGDEQIFRMRPNTHIKQLAFGLVEPDQLSVVVAMTEEVFTPEDVRGQFEEMLSIIDANLKALKEESGAFNPKLVGKIQDELSDRLLRRSRHFTVARDLGFPCSRKDT